MTAAQARTDAATQPREAERPGPVLSGPLDPAAWIDQQRRAAEAFAAAGRTFLEGFQEVATRSLLVQSALLQQAFTSMLSLTQLGASGASGDDGVRAATSAMESSVASIRDVMAAACKCHVDTLGAFRSRMGEEEHASGAACDRPEPPRAAA